MSSRSLDTRFEFDTAVDLAVRAAGAYYDGHEPIMSDADYDTLIGQIAAAFNLNPDWDPRDVLDSVAAGASAGGEVKHPERMLSLAKAKELADVNGLVEQLNTGTITEVKLDGLAVRAVYEHGELILVATRGDGRTGEDVTAQALNITGLPLQAAAVHSFEVRGEVFMTDADFEIASANRVAAGKSAFVNPRNATAGTLRNTDQNYHAPMSFAAYDASGEGLDGFDDHVDRMDRLAWHGIQTAIRLLPDVDPTQAPEKVIEIIGQRRETLGFPIDGAVVKARSNALRVKMGETASTPRWAVAFKYPPLEATSILRDIELAVGRTGRLSLRAVIDPVFVAGTTVSYATLHHVEWVVNQGLGIGSRVAVVRAGDVIPRVTAAIGEQPEGIIPWTAPSTCPQCGEAWNTDSLIWRCETPTCSTIGRIEYACSRDVWDIEGVSEAIATALVDAGLVNTIADLFRITPEQIAEVNLGETASGHARTIGPNVAAKIYEQIQKAKSQPLHRQITALGVRMTGRTMGRRLASHFRTLEAFRNATIEELAEVDGVGAERARTIREGLDSMKDLIDDLIAAGITTSSESAAVSAGTNSSSLPLAGQKVVVTGSVPGLTRTEAQEAVERLGGVASGSISKSTTLVVAGDGAGSKLEKATALGIRIMEADEFARLAQG